MSKRNRAKRGRPEDTAPVGSEEPPEGSGWMRRALLGLFASLVVARPLLRGESLGLSSDLADAGGLLWVFLVMLAGLAWAAWRLYSRQLSVCLGRVELAFLLSVGLLWVGVAWACYHRAAMLAGCEWMGLAFLLLLTRQLARSEREQQGLFAVLLATGVAMAVQGVYQSTYELPRQRAEIPAESDAYQAVRQRFTRRLEPLSSAEADLLARRLEEARAHGPYLYPSTLAGAMVLLLPGLFAAFVAARRTNSQGWQQALALAATGSCVAALLLTREWLFVLPLIVVGGCVATRCSARGILASLVLTGMLAAGLHFAGSLQDDISRRGDAWGAAWRLITQASHSLNGVGPAMSEFWLPRHLAETAGTVLGPSSAAMELWAEGGVFVLLAFAAVAVLAVQAVRRWWTTTPPVERDMPHEPTTELPLEYYIGGMAGVLLAFMVRASLLVQSDIFPAAMLASLGALAWFASFAVFEQLAWTKAERMTALMAGVAALSAALLINPGLGMPSLTGLLVVMLGLMLALAEPAPVPWLGYPGVGATLPLPVLLASSLAFLLFVVAPASMTTSAHRRTRMDMTYYLSELTRPQADRAFKNPREALDRVMLTPLLEAEKGEPRVVKTCVLLAHLYAERWSLDIRQEDTTRDGARAVAWAVLADASNRESILGKLAEADVFNVMGTMWTRIAAGREKAADDPKSKLNAGQKKRAKAEALQARINAKKQYNDAALALKDTLPRDPTDPRLRFRYADLLGKSGFRKGQREQAEEAARLDQLVRNRRRLSKAQRFKVEEWIKPELSK